MTDEIGWINRWRISVNIMIPNLLIFICCLFHKPKNIFEGLTSGKKVIK